MLFRQLKFLMESGTFFFGMGYFLPVTILTKVLQLDWYSSIGLTVVFFAIFAIVFLALRLSIPPMARIGVFRKNEHQTESFNTSVRNGILFSLVGLPLILFTIPGMDMSEYEDVSTLEAFVLESSVHFGVVNLASILLVWMASIISRLNEKYPPTS